MCNKGNKKKRCTIFYVHPLDPVGVALLGEEGDKLRRHVLYILGLYIPQAGDALDIAPEELGAEEGFVKDELAAAVRQPGVQDDTVFGFAVSVFCVLFGHKLFLSASVGTEIQGRIGKHIKSLPPDRSALVHMLLCAMW